MNIKILLILLSLLLSCSCKGQNKIFLHSSDTLSFDIDAFLPDTIPLADGNTITIYNDNVCYIPLSNKNNQYITYTWICDIGSSSATGYTISASGVGEYLCSLIVKFRGRYIDSAHTIIKITEKQVFSSEVILNIGNSLTNIGWEDQMTAILTNINGTLTTTGTQTTGVYLDEGRSGWQFSTFITAGSPFWYAGNKLDFTQYITDNALTTPDIVVMSLGVNDAWNTTSLTLIEIYARKLIDSCAWHFPSALILVSLETTCENIGDGWTLKYGTTQNAPPGSNGYENYMIRMRSLWKYLYGRYGNGAISQRIQICYGGLIIDRDNDYPKDAGGFHNNCVHPQTSGYTQIGKAIANCLNYYY